MQEIPSKLVDGRIHGVVFGRPIGIDSNSIASIEAVNSAMCACLWSPGFPLATTTDLEDVNPAFLRPYALTQEFIASIHNK